MWKVITPAGEIIVDDLAEAQEYKRLYGYPYIKINDYETIKSFNESKTRIRVLPKI